MSILVADLRLPPLLNLPQEVIDDILGYVLSPDCLALQDITSLSVLRTCSQLRESALQYFTSRTLALAFVASGPTSPPKAYSRCFWARMVRILQCSKAVRVTFENFDCEEFLLRMQIKEVVEIWTCQNHLDQLTIRVPPRYCRNARCSLDLQPNEVYAAALEPLNSFIGEDKVQWEFDFYSPCAPSSVGSLLAALEDGDLNAVCRMLENGAGVNKVVDELQGCPLRIAAWHGHLDLVTLLIQHGADVNMESGRPATSVLWAAVAGYHIQLIRTLIHHGANVNASGGYGDTVLERACYGYPAEIVRELLAGLDQSIDLRTTLRWSINSAMMTSRFDIVKMIIDECPELIEQANHSGLCIS